MADYDCSENDRARLQQARRETVVLLHSSASSSRQWSALVEALQPRFEMHAVDLHGHGAKPGWSGNQALTLADEAALVEPLLRQAGGAHVVGHSYGGAVALKLATLHPHLVHSVIAYEPVLFGWMIGDRYWDLAVRDVVALVSSIRGCLARGDEHAAAARFLSYWSGSSAWHSMPSRRRQAVAARMCAVLSHFDAVFREPFEKARITSLEMPMLYLTGENTVDSTRRIGSLFREVCPRAEHAVLPGMAHMGPITHAVEVNRRIKKFLFFHGWRSRAFEESNA